MYNLSAVEYPVFRLKSDMVEKDGIVYAKSTGLVLDNKNLGGKTLAERRLKYKSWELAHTGDMLFSLSAITNFPKRTKYIDSNGMIFRLNKTKYYKLKSHIITEVIPSTSTLYISYIKVQGIRQCIRYTGIAPPRIGSYAQVLEYKGGFLYFGSSDDKQKDTRKKL